MIGNIRLDSARRKLLTAAIIIVLAAPGLYLIGVWAFFAEWLGMGWRFLAELTSSPTGFSPS